MLDELIETTNRLCTSLEEAANSEKKFCHDVCLLLEQYSWETYKMANNIKDIRDFEGV